MPRTSVDLDEDQARPLRQVASKEGRPLADLVREALGGYLARRGLASGPFITDPDCTIAADEWQSRFTEALERIRAKTPTGLAPDDIESEITTAHEEVRRERLKRRQVARG